MLKKYLNQIITKSWKPLNFTILNKIDESGYIAELRAYYNKDYDDSDFEYIIFDMSDIEKDMLNKNDSMMLNFISTLKATVENKIQDNKYPKMKIIYFPDIHIITCVKLKELDLNSLLL